MGVVFSGFSRYGTKSNHQKTAGFSFGSIYQDSSLNANFESQQYFGVEGYLPLGLLHGFSWSPAMVAGRTGFG